METIKFTDLPKDKILSDNGGIFRELSGGKISVVFRWIVEGLKDHDKPDEGLAVDMSVYHGLRSKNGKPVCVACAAGAASFKALQVKPVDIRDLNNSNNGEWGVLDTIQNSMRNNAVLPFNWAVSDERFFRDLFAFEQSVDSLRAGTPAYILAMLKIPEKKAIEIEKFLLRSPNFVTLENHNWEENLAKIERLIGELEDQGW